jgi:hypothetical protein
MICNVSIIHFLKGHCYLTTGLLLTQDKHLLKLKDSKSQAIPKSGKENIRTTIDDVQRLAKFFRIPGTVTEDMFHHPTTNQRMQYRLTSDQLLPYYWHTAPGYTWTEAIAAGCDQSKFGIVQTHLQEEHARQSGEPGRQFLDDAG